MSTPAFCGTFYVTPKDLPDFYKRGNMTMNKCRVIGASGNSRQRRQQVRAWKRQDLRVTPYSRSDLCVVHPFPETTA